jgi:hypothetical protein
MNAQAITLEGALGNAMQTRREIETEMAGIDSEIRKSIMAGDAAAMTRLQSRKRELPLAYIKASHAERQLADRIHGQARTDAQSALTKATADYEAQREAFEKLQDRHRRELEEAAHALRESETAKGAAQGALIGANNVLVSSQQGCERALGRVAEAF